MDAPTSELIATATRQQRAGNFAAAERLYSDVLRQHPTHCDALNLLGALRIAQSRYGEAVDLIRAALRQKPSFFRAHFNLGLAFAQLGRHEDAVTSYTRAIALRPDYPQAFNSRGNALVELNRLHEAVASYRQAIHCNANYAEAHCNLGVALGRAGDYELALPHFDCALAIARDAKTLHQKGNVLVASKRYQEALDAYEGALSINTNDAKVLCHRGNALAEINRKQEALESYGRALELLPDYQEARVNRGALLSSLLRFEEASADFADAFASAGDYAPAYLARGQMLVQLRRYNDALVDFDSALAIKPDFVHALVCRGTTLAHLCRVDEAIDCFSAALAINPKSIEALLNSAIALASEKRFEEAIGAYERLLAMPGSPEAVLGPYLFAKLCACDWRQLEPLRERLQERAVVGADTEVDPFIFVNACGDPHKQLARARKFAIAKLPIDVCELWTGIFQAKSKVRIAYLSANFNQHPVADTIVELLERHDRTRFEIIGISFGVDDASNIRKRVVMACDEFYEVIEHSDREVAEMMRERHIDIAVDLMGHTGDSRPNILAYRPAPVQVSYLGYPGTTGAPFIDYLIADAVVIPPEYQECYSEAIAVLPDSYLPIDSTRCASTNEVTRAQQGLPEQGFVFCCFNNHYKISALIFAVWMSLLKRVEGSVLWLLGGNSAAEKNLRREAQAHGVDPSRLIFAARTERLEDHLARHRLAGLFLDTPEYNAHSTARDALWAELPLINCVGKSFASRVAPGLLQSLQMPELITETLAEYERLALDLATDAQYMRRIREKLSQKRLTTRLFDVDCFRRHLEAAYTTMIERKAGGQPPSSFSVAIEEPMTD